MAWLEKTRSGVFNIVYRYAERKWKRSLKTKERRQAEALRVRLQENLRLAELGQLEIPTDADLSTFLLSNGKHPKKTSAKPTLYLGQLFQQFLESLPADSLEAETLRVARIHMGHLRRLLGANTPVRQISQADLQSYVTRRSTENGKGGKTVSSVTIKKELGTFSSIWTYAHCRGDVSAPFPNRHLRFPKTNDKPLFQTREQIDRQIALGGLSSSQQNELWHSLFLTLPEVQDVLSLVEQRAQYSFLYPMVVMASHTGARRSELCRSRVTDFQFDSGVVVIHEKKRIRGQRSTRQVPLSPLLERVIRFWISAKRTSEFTFPRELKVDRSRKQREFEDAVSVDEASHHLAMTLTGTHWSMIRGWHIFRHSFCSNCAARGVDQRLINAWVGHQTDEMVRRYRHLVPDQQRAAIQSVFND